MAKKFFQRFMPDPHRMRNHKHLQFFGKLLHNPNLWHLNRRSVTGAVAVGLFMAFVPLPSQMVPAAALAIVFHVNLPIAVAMTWVTNPFTSVPFAYFAYKMGSFMLGRPPQNIEFHLTWDWLMAQLHWIWQPLLLGSFAVAAVAGVLGYALAQLLWRFHVVRDWNKRRKARDARPPDA